MAAHRDESEATPEETAGNLELFNYRNLNDTLQTSADFVANPDFSVMASGRNLSAKFDINFIFFTAGNPAEDFLKNKGWKFHISLNDEIEGNVAKGWDVLCNILIKHNIATSKVVREGIRMSEEPEQRGKQVTIYSFHNPEMGPNDWKNFLTEVTEAFVQHNVQPGYRCVGSDLKPEYQIAGSNYVTYRYDDKDNPNDNPFEDLVIEVPDQPDPQEWVGPGQQARMMA